MDYSADVGAPRSEEHKLIIYVTVFELTRHMPIVHQHHRRTDGWTDIQDGRMTYDSNTAPTLCVSLAKSNL